MKKLFELSKISIQEMVDEDGLDIYLAYNEDLLAKNILIEFYESDLEGESETAIFVISCDKSRTYSFVLYVVSDFIKPLQLFRLVTDAVDFISMCSKETILSDLEQISTGFSTSDEFENVDEKNHIYETESWKFNTAMELIRESLKG